MHTNLSEICLLNWKLSSQFFSFFLAIQVNVISGQVLNQLLSLFISVRPRIKPLQDLAITVHSSLNLTCIVEGDPFPVFYWMKNGKRIIGQMSSYNRTLTINNVDLSTEGTYTCHASNRAGNTSSSAFAEILSKTYKIAVTWFLLTSSVNCLLIAVRVRFS